MFKADELSAPIQFSPVNVTIKQNNLRSYVSTLVGFYWTDLFFNLYLFYKFIFIGHDKFYLSFCLTRLFSVGPVIFFFLLETFFNQFGVSSRKLTYFLKFHFI